MKTTLIGIPRGWHLLPVFDSINSTNTWLKQNAASLNDRTILIAREQSEGRGRNERRFHSAKGKGLYLSLLLKPDAGTLSFSKMTALSALALQRAIRESCQLECQIKWVNDLYLHNKKVCGILTEAVTDFESGNIEFAVVGIGLNLYMPEDGFPEDIQETAGALFENRNDAEHINCSILVAEIVNQLLMEVETPGLSREYTENNIIPGNMIVITDGQCTREAYAESIAPDGRLLVREQDGSETLLSYGEVSVRRKSDQG